MKKRIRKKLQKKLIEVFVKSNREHLLAARVTIDDLRDFYSMFGEVKSLELVGPRQVLVKMRIPQPIPEIILELKA